MTDIQDQLTAALADTYAVERKLGEGGMAVVYLARDVKHDRLVAIKVLHPDLAASLGAERFLREIQITAKLSHPHILPLYDSGEADGFLYYVMPFIQGESLSDLMEREKQLAFEEAIRITREVAEALAHAHSYGLIHRDIKPDNIMMSGGHAIVADFGIARAVSEAGAEKLTQTGMAIGTPAYMSPEQAAGEENVDGRTDIYSLGCVLYEMVVGQVPFTGPTPVAVMARHSMDDVPRPSIMRQTLPEDLEDIIYCAMAKAPADRYRTAQEMVEALNAVGSGKTGPRRLSISGVRRAQGGGRRTGGALAFLRKAALPVGGGIALLAVAFVGWRVIGHRGGGSGASESIADMSHIAVLYFQDRSPDKSLDYLASGLTEGLIQQLSNVAALHVVSANGVRPYRHADVPPDSLHKALGVGTLVEGTVAQSGDRFRVGTQLVNARTGDVIADTTIDLPKGDVFALQDTLAQDVSLFLRKRLGTEVTVRTERSATHNAQAWEAYQRAKQAEQDIDALAAAGDTAAVRRRYAYADSLLTVAVSLDSKWAAPTVERGNLDVQRARTAYSMGDAEATDHWTKVALERAASALDKAPDDADALALRGTARYYRVLANLVPDLRAANALGDSAEADLRKAIAADSTKAEALLTMSHLLMRRSQTAEAKLYAQRALAADPYLRDRPQALWRLFQTSLDLEDKFQSAHWCDELNREYPNTPRSAVCSLQVQMLKTDPGRVDSAWQALHRLLAFVPPSDTAFNRRLYQMQVALVIARAGLKDSARHVALDARAEPSLDPGRQTAYVEAAVRAWVGDKDEAVRLLSDYLAANPQGRQSQAEDDSWYWRPIRDYAPYRALLGLHGSN